MYNSDVEEKEETGNVQRVHVHKFSSATSRAPVARHPRTAAREEQEGDNRDGDRRVLGRVQPGEETAELRHMDREAADELILGGVGRVEEALVVPLEHVAVAGLADDAVEDEAPELKVVIADDVADLVARRG